MMAETFNHGYALLIGVGESKYHPLSLPVTVKDTQAIYGALTDHDLCGYPQEQIRVLNNDEATRNGILQGLSWLKEKMEADREATAIVYYSGHGWVDKSDNRYYLLQHDVKPSKLAESALSAEVFTNAIREIEAERLLVVIDSCHAAGMATSKDADAELMDEFDGFERVAFSKGLIENLKRSKGRVVFTSSEGHQESWILKNQSLSIYTFHFLEALQGAGNQTGDLVVRVSNLMNYLGKSVPETTRQVYDRDQTPHFDFDTGDFAIALLRGGKGLSEKGWDEVRSEVGQKVNKIADKIVQKGKFITNINEAKELHIGDNFYGGDRTSHKSVVQKGLENVQVGGNLTVNINQNDSNRYDEQVLNSNQITIPSIASVDELVQQVRSRIHDDIQRLHGTMPLWGVDHWVPLGDLFVDVNILEELSSSRRSELDDLWRDFSQTPSYRSLDRIGLGKDLKRMSGLEILTKNKNLMMVGKPGSGKTTYLQNVVTECNAGNIQAHRIPLLIRLREFVDDGRDVQYSLEPYLKSCWQLSNTEIKLLLNQGRVLVLLDGLDEVTGEDGKTITKEIKKFARTYSQVLVIVTCRTQSQESRFERFDYVEISDFNELQVKLFTENWFKTVSRDKSDEWSQKFLNLLFLEENKHVRELAITPILLSLTCAVFYQTGKFYSKRSNLYEEGLEILLDKWDKLREIERDEIYRDLSLDRKLELLSYIAVKKFEQTRYVLFEQEELEKNIAEFLGVELRDSRAVLKAIESQHGLLIERTQRVWSFSHLTFQEYLVAKWFCQAKNWQTLASHIGQKYWKEVFLITMEVERCPDEILRLIKTETDKIMSEDADLQKFLVWLNEKSLSIQTKFKSSAIRALYLCELDPDIEIGDNLPEIIDPQVKNIILDKYRFDTNIDNPWQITLDFSLDPDRCPDFAEIKIALKLYPKFGKILTQLSEQVSYRYHDEQKFSIWWELHGHEWTKRYRDALIKYRNIAHDRKFSVFQKEVIESYCYANQLLINCLTRANMTNKMNQRVRKEIEETLLLPIAEIEKYKRDKLE